MRPRRDHHARRWPRSCIPDAQRGRQDASTWAATPMASRCAIVGVVEHAADAVGAGRRARRDVHHPAGCACSTATRSYVGARRARPARPGDEGRRGRARQDRPRRLVVIQQDASTRTATTCYRDDRAIAWMLVRSPCCCCWSPPAASSAWPACGSPSGASRSACAARSARASVDILRYFMTENFIIATGGIVAGDGAGVGLNQLLVSELELAELPLGYLAVGALRAVAARHRRGATGRPGARAASRRPSPRAARDVTR